jgi:formylglycine-generating enzyme required for sulfatase activity/serine/threonine protein kinase
MPDPIASPDPASLAERVYFEAVFAHGGGRPLDLDALCRAHADLAGELREVHQLWLHLKGQTIASLGERLRERFGPAADPGVSLQGVAEPAAGFTSAVIERLAGRTRTFARYQIEGEVARGGMGAILRVWDGDLRRHLAMKVVLGKDEAAPGGAPHRGHATALARFLEEAQVTSQLDHPGIVPVHELGLDDEGRVYFTMKLVEGQTLREVFDELSRGAGGWTQTRVLGLLLKVCEALGFAHAKGVIHRDLKPANVMVGKFGEVYVMDWGLAKILGREDARDLRVRQPEERGADELESDRRDRGAQTPGSPLVTMEGEVVGTPAYMSPEQAQGKLSEMGPASDVYAVGAMLYHLLAGHMPYAGPGSATDNYSLWRAVQAGPPAPLHAAAPQVPPELIAICGRAMARERSLRYAGVAELADDLSAYIEGRVVKAYEAGAWAEARKWVRRNRALAASLAAAMVVTAGGLAGIACVQARGRAAAEEERSVAEQERARADAQAEEAARLAEEARAQREDVLSLSAQKDLDDLVADARRLWPAHPDMLPAYGEWLQRAEELIDGRLAGGGGDRDRPSLAQHRARLLELRAGAVPTVPEQPLAGPHEAPAAANAGGSAATEDPRLFEYADPDHAWWDILLSKLVADLEALCDPETGLMGDTLAAPFGWGVAKRSEFARTIRERSVEGAEAARAWSEAIAAIEASPYYAGLRLPPQLGLLPIGEDPASGLWEFAHLQTGSPAVRSPEGRLALTEATGLVLVLIPGGTFWMGAQADDPAGRNHDPQAKAAEGPVHEVELSPFFLSKYEMTQGQWLGIAGENPSLYRPPNRMTPSLLHPVENVSWVRCMEILERLALTLPSEAQWEYAARGGTDTPWWTGAERESLRGSANLADQSARRAGAPWRDIGDWPELDDGFPMHAPPRSFAENPFGLESVCGNLWEWCLDGHDEEFYGQAPFRDPVCDPAGSSFRQHRGGCFYQAAADARSANRGPVPPDYADNGIGLRPARAIAP